MGKCASNCNSTFSVENPIFTSTVVEKPYHIPPRFKLFFISVVFSGRKQYTMDRGVVHACHAGGVVHLLEGWTHHEVGAIDVDRIDLVWEAALKHGLKPVSTKTTTARAAAASTSTDTPCL